MTLLLDHYTLKRLSADATLIPAGAGTERPFVLASERSRLACRWHKDGSGRLTCTWNRPLARKPVGPAPLHRIEGTIDMNTNRLHAPVGETCALTRLSSPPDEPAADCAAENRTVHPAPSGSWAIEIDENGLLRVGIWVVGFLGLLAVYLLFLTLLPVKLIPSTAARAEAAHPVSIVSGRARAVSNQPAAANIVPAEVIDANPVFFIGTGDQSAGSWTQP